MGFLLVALGGALGASGRYALTGWLNNLLGPGPLALFAVNISGSFAIGLFMALGEDHAWIDLDVRRFVGIGLLGGYTTFSSWMFETVEMLEHGEYLRATANGLGSLAAGLLAVGAGIALGRMI